ncbi:MAG: VWA domain-containing protein [candidate division NC10 bacterium]|nr:VWA domain-containing protein [candidate division NC10 bacterium]
MRKPRLLLLLGLLSFLGRPISGASETKVEVAITSPPQGTVVHETAQVRIEGYAQLLREHALQQYDIMLIIDVSGSTGAPSGVDVNSNRVTGGGVGGPIMRSPLGRTIFSPSDPGDSILAAEVVAAERLLDKLDPRIARVGIVAFSGSYNRLTGLPIPGAPSAVLEQPLTSNYDLVRMALRKILQQGPNGGTDMAAGVRLAIRELAGLQGHVSLPNPGSKKVAVLLTDGFPTLPFGRVNTMDPEDIEVAINAAKVAAKGDIPIHTFALGPEALSAPLACTEIARVSRGTFTPLQNPGEVIDILPKTSFAELDLVSVQNETTGELARDLVVNPDGRFHAEVPLTRGVNQIVVNILATDGTKGLASVLVHYLVGESLELELARQREELKLQLERLKERTEALELELKRQEKQKAEEEGKKALELEIKKAEEEQKVLELEIRKADDEPPR